MHWDLQFERQQDLGAFEAALAVCSVKSELHVGGRGGGSLSPLLMGLTQEGLADLLLKQLNIQELNCTLSLPQLLLI